VYTFCSQPSHCGQELLEETLPKLWLRDLLVAGIHSRAVCTRSLELQRERYPSALLLLLLLLLCVLFCIFDLKDQQLNDLHSRTGSESFQSLLCKYQPGAVFILALHREFSTRFLCVLLSSWLLICDVLFLVEEIAILSFLESEKIAYKAVLSKFHSDPVSDLVSDAAKLEQILRSVELDRIRIELCNVAHICVESRGLIREPLLDRPWR